MISCNLTRGIKYWPLERSLKGKENYFIKVQGCFKFTFLSLKILFASRIAGTPRITRRWFLMGHRCLRRTLGESQIYIRVQFSFMGAQSPVALGGMSQQHVDQFIVRGTIHSFKPVNSVYFHHYQQLTWESMYNVHVTWK